MTGSRREGKNWGLRLEIAGSLCFPSRTCSPSPLFPGAGSGSSTRSPRPSTVLFKCDTRPSQTGSSAQSGSVGRGGERVTAAVSVARLRGRGEPDGPCSGSLRPGSSLQPPGKRERTLQGALDRAGRREGVCDKDLECNGGWGEGPPKLFLFCS